MTLASLPARRSRSATMLLAASMLTLTFPPLRSQAPAEVAEKPSAAAAAAKPPVFDVVSIKPNRTGSGGVDIDYDNGNYSAVNVSLRALLINAYGLKEGQIVALPPWGDSARFDIKAKVVDADPTSLGKLTREQRRAMLQSILTDRFGLTSHTETKVLPVYELVVAKGGPKFKPSAAADHRNDMTTHNQELTATSVRMESLATELSSRLQHIVIDKTALDGHYDFTLKWSRDDAPASDSENAPPVLLTAVQEQLGLKLVAAKAPVQTFVIDHAEMPSEN